MTFDEYLKQQLSNDPALKKQYNRLKLQYTIKTQIIRLHKFLFYHKFSKK